LATAWCGSVASAASRPVLVCFGDSITAGYGLQTGQAYSDFLQQKLDDHGYKYKVINQGTSGATTKDAVASLPNILRLQPEIVIVEFGGNDGLRGLPTTSTQANLDQVLTTLEKAHIKVLLAGITLPPDYGPDYIHAFEAVFRAMANNGQQASCPLRSHDLQRPCEHPRHNSKRRHSSDREGLGADCRHAVCGAEADVAQVKQWTGDSGQLAVENRRPLRRQRAN
jgi:acyl-CoA thioesterase-1